MKKKIKGSSKLPKVDSALNDQVKVAQTNLEDYLKKNKLDPTKDWSKDKKHGKAIKELVSLVSVAREKIAEAAPKEIHHKKSEDKKKTEGDKPAKVKKEKSTPTKYDYPQVDGREMTSGEKKKYRVEMRKKSDKPDKVAKVAKTEKVEKTSSKKNKVTKEEAKPKKAIKNKKKLGKKED